MWGELKHMVEYPLTFQILTVAVHQAVDRASGRKKGSKSPASSTCFQYRLTSFLVQEIVYRSDIIWWFSPTGFHIARMRTQSNNGALKL